METLSSTTATKSDEAPTDEEIRSQLERIVLSSEFPGAGRGALFLRYVVEESLAGRADRIKGYTIAIEVFGRNESCTLDDPVVRIEAARLRRSLERYYLLEGHKASVRIDIPKGGYAPLFSRSSINASMEAYNTPTVDEPEPRRQRCSAGSPQCNGSREVPEEKDIQTDIASGKDVIWHFGFGTKPGISRLWEIARMVELNKDPGYVWIAGEAKQVSDLRQHFAVTQGLDKDRLTAIGYWTKGKTRD